MKSRIFSLQRIAWALVIIAAVNLAGGSCVSRGIAASLHEITVDVASVFGGSR